MDARREVHNLKHTEARLKQELKELEAKLDHTINYVKQSQRQYLEVCDIALKEKSK